MLWWLKSAQTHERDLSSPAVSTEHRAHGGGLDLIFVIFSPQMYFWAQFFSTIVMHGKLKFLHNFSNSWYSWQISGLWRTSHTHQTNAGHAGYVKSHGVAMSDKWTWGGTFWWCVRYSSVIKWWSRDWTPLHFDNLIICSIWERWLICNAKVSHFTKSQIL